ncbi:NAD-dependent succinate-semialdehyde dehydrogenase [Larsenimonas suaedae]|uniref:NAD-dependent succinate-semialdehyde dehydrogenase n=1 Tax=Larsenimonas suaedae TaxID=1851019 RepID=A0ABU1GSE8_9GAMM|nr:NAD-dependent succinate-semialdehyde dehydrogenase [Larsenimonas suaedae]MCM2972255.1 NAD-dependent succinate-semialdehyde dehydrogenase [Larsenimonas suaedae]MDR5894949.1 NAD-dependent succinate-semialdehyde dehydrogenase [Larsenimonas suaedae]
MELNDPRLFRELAYIDGQWMAGDQGRDLAVDDPATGEILGHVALLEREQVSHAVTAAERAFPAWRALGVNRRAEILSAWCRLLHEHKRDLANIMTLEQGKPLSDARGEVEYGASFLHWFAEEGKRAYGATIPSHLEDSMLGTIKEPVGISAMFTPWNFPLAMITRKAGAALAAGCPVVVKPAGETPFSALALAELAERAGVPGGVFNVVMGEPEVVSEVLCTDARVRSVSFTGSTRVGKLLLEQSASSVKRVALELGGNAPFIVGPDMDPDEAAAAALAAKFQTAGQDCLAANRIFVHSSLYERFIECFAARMKKLNVGNGVMDVDIGPLIHARAVDTARALVDDGVAKGARLIAGDQSMAPGTNFFMPTLLADITTDMRVFREETFSPVAAVCAFDDDDEVISRANDTEYGLAAYVYTHDIRRIYKYLRGLEYGMVSVNTLKMTGAPVPFGGVKQSGLGREGGHLGLDEYLDTKYFCMGGVPSVSGS